MKYIELKIHASRQGVEAVSQLLMDRGIYEISVDDPADIEVILNKKNEYDWDYIDDSIKSDPDREPVVSAYVDDSDQGRQLIQEIKIALMKLKSDEAYGIYGPDADFGRLYAESETVDDEDWKDKWKENFKPVRVTEHIVVKPTWESYLPTEGDIILEIDPGMAFGTGTHETTSLCMKLLEKYIAKAAGAGMPAEDMAILDVGCGSGILAISAALLGCRNILGVEIDPDAVRVALENVQLNGVGDRVSVREGDLTKGIDFQADIIVANLMHNLVIMLSPSAYQHLKPGGIFISSGILLEKRDQVAEAVREAGFEILEIPEDGEWCAIAAIRKQ